MQCGERHADIPGCLNKIEEVIACGLFVGEEELGNGSGIAREQFSVGPSGEPLLNFANDLSGRELILS